VARRKKSGGGGDGEPAWLVTFSDLMTLLLTFFVLLLSMAVIDERAKLVVLGSVSRTFGTQQKIFNPLTEDAANRPVEPGPMEAPQDDLTPLRDMLFEDVNKDLDFQENKYVQIFSINDQVLFKPGGTELSASGIDLLDRILPYLQRINYPLLVAGHTAVRRDEEADAYRLSGGNAPDSTWPLSFHRSLSVYRHLSSRGIAPSRLSLEAFGQYHPRYSNNNPEGRRKNRRVDLVLDKRNLEWIRKVEALREEEAV
jgi:chemotaxis protein MotB